jgi:phosphate starvation-inducible PhoH-like protein
LNKRPSSDHPESNDFILEPLDNQRLANLCGQMDEHLRQIERGLGVEISSRGNHFRIIGDSPSVQTAGKMIRRLYDDADETKVTSARVHLLLQETDHQEHISSAGQEEVLIRTRHGVIKGRSPRQIHYLRHILTHDINFGIGPAGTGKTYLAVACAVEALEKERVRRLLLVRPAVEAGERLGFLPGDLTQKIDPYLRPLYDALYEMLGFERVAKLIERHVIEVAPLAYMRGRTLNESFIILDEAQNTTVEQMKMFLTRLGYGSITVVTGDVTQIDLPKGQPSGLRHVIEVLRDVKGISFTFFQSRDVVRHPLVQRVVQAYERFGRGNGGES